MIRPYEFDLAVRENSPERRALYEWWHDRNVRRDAGEGSPLAALNDAGSKREEIEEQVWAEADRKRGHDEKARDQWFRHDRGRRIRQEWLPAVVANLAHAFRHAGQSDEDLPETIHEALKADGHAQDLGLTVEMIRDALPKRPGALR
jgi:hypothetical protein